MMNIRLLHLVVVIAVSTVAVSIGGVLVTYQVIENEVQDLLDDDLEAQSELLAQVLAAQGGLVSAAELERLVVQIFEPDQEETLWINLYDPRSGRQLSNLDHALPAPALGTGPIQLELQGYRWFGYQHGEPDGPVVQLLHRRDRYQEVREEVLEGAVLPAVAVSAVNLLLLVGLTMLFLGPLTRMARDLERRRPDSLEPVSIDTPARELVVLGEALNRLMADVDRVLGREREFASDVAHELRTPLTTLKLELSMPDPDLAALKSEVDRLVALVTQLLTLARLQRTEWRQSFRVVDLDSLFGATLAAMDGRLEQAGVASRAYLEPAQVLGDETLLDILLRNLLQNVIRHCPRGCRVDVRLSGLADAVQLEVEDTGPGMSAEEREWRNAGAARLDRRGRGLGLAICNKIADVHLANVQFLRRSDGASGLRVLITFPGLMSA